MIEPKKFLRTEQCTHSEIVLDRMTDQDPPITQACHFGLNLLQPGCAFQIPLTYA